MQVALTIAKDFPPHFENVHDDSCDMHSRERTRESSSQGYEDA